MTTNHTILSSPRAEITLDSEMIMELFFDARYHGADFTLIGSTAQEALAMAVRIIYAVWLYEPDLAALCMCNMGIDIIKTYNNLETK